MPDGGSVYEVMIRHCNWGARTVRVADFTLHCWEQPAGI